MVRKLGVIVIVLIIVILIIIVVLLGRTPSLMTLRPPEFILMLHFCVLNTK